MHGAGGRVKASTPVCYHARGMINQQDPPAEGACGKAPGRRVLLKRAVFATIGLTVGRAAALGQDDPASNRPRAGDLLVRATDSSATPLTAADIPSGPPLTAWAMEPESGVVRSGSRFNQVVLLKLDAAKLNTETRERAAEGVVAYSVICPHSGCDVVDWIGKDELLFCGCHSTAFDPKDGARVVDGPAPRSLPALPLRVAGGRLVVAGGFTDKVGFESA